MARTKQTARAQYPGCFGNKRPEPRTYRAPAPPQPAYITKPINADDHVGSYNPLLPPIFPIRVDALCDIATVSFAASLIQYKLKLIREHSDDDDELELLNLRTTPETDLISLPLPTIIKQRTTALLPTMNDSLRNWNDYHFRMIYWDLKNREDIVGEWLDEIVWMSNGSINYGHTAGKILHSGKMDPIKKYRLACVYCFEDSVKNLASKLGHESLKLDREHHRNHCNNLLFLFDYWYSIIWPNDYIQTFDMRYNGSFNKECLMLRNLISLSGHNFNSIEYLWNNSNFKDRMRFQNEIGKTCNPLYTWRVLIDLNAFEFDVVIKADVYRILQCFAKDSRFEEVAITIWRYMLERIVDDEELAKNFIAARGEKMYNIFDVEHESHLIQLMWHNAPERLRLAIHQGIKDNISDDEDDFPSISSFLLSQMISSLTETGSL